MIYDRIYIDYVAMKRKLLIAFSILFLGSVSGWQMHEYSARDKPEKIVPLSAEPKWVREQNCMPPDLSRKRQTATALDALEAFPTSYHPMFSSAVKYFGHPAYWVEWTKKDGKRDKSFHVCRPSKLYPRIAELVVTKNLFRGGGSPLFEDELNLAAELGPLDPVIVEAVANTAFFIEPIETSALGRDIRSYARTVLAQFGELSKPWAEQAFAEVSTEDALGTGALQVAVAAKVPGAILLAEKLLSNLLDNNDFVQFDEISQLQRLKGTIGPHVRDRMYELAYAISMGEPDAEAHSEPIIRLLDYAVTTGSHFGSLVVRPSKMCVVLKRIGGRAAEAADRHSSCSDENLVRSLN